ncbi:MAG: NAD(+) synthase [Deltaproteobacteria bacterium]|nr:NAD(+) synthase [Deltaproteobacteria bacterium]
MATPEQVTPAVLEIDCGKVAEEIQQELQEAVFKQLRKKGAVVGVSGGIDSSVTAALCARALGNDRVLALFTPEGESAGDTLTLSRMVADALGVKETLEDISPILEAAGCYRRRDEAIRSVIPDYGPGWKSKLVLPSVIDSDRYRIFKLVAVAPNGETVTTRLSPAAYLGVVAATNFKQLTHKMMEHYHADRLNYAVAGTPNRLEYDQGFFVKGGDGLADFKPIAHLYKSQVYQLAAHLGIPETVRSRPPTTDTYSLPQGQDEFYFSLSYDKMDLCLWAKNHGHPPESLSEALQLEPEQIERVYRDIDNKRRTTRYLQLKPLLVEDVEEIEALLRA